MKFAVGLVFCLFMGITAISVGLGAAFPSINQIAQPVVCPGGTMGVDSHRYVPYPGKTVITRNWYCETSGERSELSMFPIALVSGGIYGLGLFILLLGIGFLRRQR